MNEEKFTEDNEFSELKKLLKEIPKVTAPDNFEFNLMTKIQNQNFGIEPKKKKSIFSWALTPAIAFAASLFLIVFLFTGNDEVGENPWNTAPRLIENNIADVEATQLKRPRKITKQISRREEVVSKSSNFASNNTSTQKFPFDKRTSVNLDDGLQPSLNNNSSVGSAQLAGSSNNNTSPFDGFFLREVEKYQREDSLQNIKDSLSESKN